jgi:hypothetical protein
MPILTTDEGFVRKASRGNGRILGQGTVAMSGLDTMTDEQFERHTLEVLGRELGAEGLARFLRLNRSGTGDYTTNRSARQKDLTIDEILDSIKQRRRVVEGHL